MFSIMKLKALSRFLLSLFLALAFVPGRPAYAAAMISTGQAVSRLALDADRRRIAEFVSRDDVKSQLEKFGVDPKEAALRVASLSDQEVQNLASQINKSTAGGDALVGVLTLVLIVLLIIYLAQRI
jgi:hypothetical protein